jgi:hypothetical protein
MGLVEFPPGPWQTVQASAFRGTGSAASAAQAMKKESAAAIIAAAPPSPGLTLTSCRS